MPVTMDDYFNDPSKYKQCSNCNGYGSSMNEEAARCTECGGSGLVEKQEAS